MRFLMIACSKTGYGQMHRMKELWEQFHPEDEIITKVKSKSMEEVLGAGSEELILGTITEYVGEVFGSTDAILFLSAAGIAVRCVAPYLVHKSKDPAVIVMDETGKYCISLVSGHAGGANYLTGEVAALCGAEPVITTATDREGKFAVDEFARKNNLQISSWEKAKEASVHVLDGGKLRILTAIPEDVGEIEPSLNIIGTMPEEVELQLYGMQNGTGEDDRPVDEILLTPFRSLGVRNEKRLRLIPQCIFAGIGCKKGIAAEKVEAAVHAACDAAGIDLRAIGSVASIDLKKDEEGILSFCKKHSLPFVTYSAEELKAVSGEYSESEFVAKVTGVGNVCERSAVLSSGGELIFKKCAYDGVTVAFAWKMEDIRFE